MFHHQHPYPPYIPIGTTKLIVGTLPPPRFSIGNLLEKDVNFCYGSYYNSLWLFIDEIHQLNLRFDNSLEAIQQRKDFLHLHKIGVCDIVDSCVREKMDASDLGMKEVQLRDVIQYLKKSPTVDTLLFTGGNTKNGPEYFFRKHLKDYNLKLELIASETPKIHQFALPESDRIIKTVSLTSPSGSANRAIGSNATYKLRKQMNPAYTTFDFRKEQYKMFF